MEDRVKKLELIVSRLARKQPKRMSAMVTPFPISNAVFGENISGPILRYMFPCLGTVTKGLITIDKRPSEVAIVGYEINNGLHNTKNTYTMTSKKFLVEPKVSVDSGDQLTVSIFPTGEDVIEEVWISFLWVPQIREVDIKRILIDDLLKEEN